MRNLSKRAPRKVRAGHGQWVEPARAVCALVDQGDWNVSDAVRAVVADFQFKNPAQAFNGVRAAYYVIRLNEKKAPEFEI